MKTAALVLLAVLAAGSESPTSPMGGVTCKYFLKLEDDTQLLFVKGMIEGWNAAAGLVRYEATHVAMSADVKKGLLLAADTAENLTSAHVTIGEVQRRTVIYCERPEFADGEVDNAWMHALNEISPANMKSRKFPQ